MDDKAERSRAALEAALTQQIVQQLEVHERLSGHNALDTMKALLSASFQRIVEREDHSFAVQYFTTLKARFEDYLNKRRETVRAWAREMEALKQDANEGRHDIDVFRID